MDIRPVDVQMLINKSSQISKHEDFNQQEFDKNLSFFEHFKKDLETDNKKTLESDKSKQSDINKDGKNSSYEKSKSEKKDKKEETKKKSAKADSISFLDISI